MGKYAIFGAGFFGKQAAELIGIANVVCFIDNDKAKQGTECLSKKIVSLEDAMEINESVEFVVAVSDEYLESICDQLRNAHIDDFKLFNDIKCRLTRDKILARIDYIELYNKAISWIYNNSIEGQGIINNTSLKKAYPEVTGYYIPTLMRWGHKELALSYARWLCSIQHDDGAWYDTEGEYPYIFDSAQILKGLIAIHDYMPEVDDHIIKGCDWILGNMTDAGRLVSPMENAWGDGKTFSELIHTYCISPIKEAGIVFNRLDYVEKANLIANYYTTLCRDQILDFDLLSHFYAYVMEAMVDIGHEELARAAMEKIAVLQRPSGAVPAYKDVDWVCSTGLFQLAIVWYRLGDIENGNKAFEYACKLQNESGGWYGSYMSEDNADEFNTYFPSAEISWAVKYFLDALYYKNLAQFENQAPTFRDTINGNDGRYKAIENIVSQISSGGRILDIGCGKGRYLRNLVASYQQNEYYAVDLSLNVMKYFDDIKVAEKHQGTLTNIPFENKVFDMTYTCEALEHAVDVKSAVKELCRVTKSGGKVVIVDKNKDKLGFFEIEEWEQWFDSKELKLELVKYCSDVEIIKEISFDDTPANGLFYCWVGTVK